MDVYILRYGELALKGRNRIDFEKRLVSNVKSFLRKKGIKFEEILRPRGRLVVYCSNDIDFSNVFGLVSFSRAKELSLDVEDMKNYILKLLGDKEFNTFRVSVKRSDKRIEFRSADLERELGSFIVEKFDKKVTLKGFDLELCVELFNDHAYVFLEREKCNGGLPLGVTGRVLCLVENKDDIEAAKLMMKRGCEVVLCLKKKINYDLVSECYFGDELKIVDFSEDIDKLVEENKCEAVVTGEKLEAFKTVKTKNLVFRPLLYK